MPCEISEICIMTEPHWTTLLSALLTPVVAILGVYIAYRQWRTAKDQATTASERLKLELFERRWTVYSAAQNLIKSIIQSGTLDRDQELPFLLGISQARFLFDEDVCKYLNEELWGMAVDIQKINKTNNGLAPLAPEKGQKRHDLMLKITDQLKTPDEKMKPYLQFQN